MYTKEDLIKYDYFKDFEIEYILDALTGIVSRGYLLGFAKYLIENNIEFAFCMIDIDNFKLVNDNYGHKTGDECLINIADSLIREVGDKGIVGRYGGDEFVIIYIGDARYEVVHPFLGSLLGPEKVARKTMCLSNVSIFVTVTIGSASFPYDAKDFSELFAKADKALYRGKIKGRNCYIVYVDEMHRNIDVHRKENTYLPDTFNSFENIFKKKEDFNSKLKAVVDSLANIFNLPDACIWFNDKTAISHLKPNSYTIKASLYEETLQLLDECDFFSSSDLIGIKKKSPALNRFFSANLIQSVIIAKIGIGDAMGVLLLYENTIVRMWQEREISTAMYIARLITAIILSNKN